MVLAGLWGICCCGVKMRGLEDMLGFVQEVSTGGVFVLVELVYS
jgi:hypothetical protein